MYRAVSVIAVWVWPVLFGAVIVLWWGSHRPWFPFKWMTLWQSSDASLQVNVGSHDGMVLANTSELVGWGPEFQSFVPVFPGVMIGELAKTFEDSKQRILARGFVIAYWWPASLMGAANVFVLVRRWRGRRVHPAGLCRACGYDLRATPERCPECGTPRDGGDTLRG